MADKTSPILKDRDKRIVEIIVKVYEMAQADDEQHRQLPVVRHNTLQWAREELHKLLNEVTKKIAEWGNEPCPHEHLNSPMKWLKRMCPECWQLLLEKEG